MAMQLRTLRTFKNNLFNPTLNLVRNRSRNTLPAIFWDDPFRSQRNSLADLWKDYFDLISPVQRYTGYHVPIMNYPWEDEKYVNNPKDGFQVSLNVENFAPNEINVKVEDNSVIVEAKHEERAEDGQCYVSRHFVRRYVLPDQVSLNDVVSTLSSDGILSVKAPPKQTDPQNIRNINIQQTGSPARNQDKTGNQDKPGKQDEPGKRDEPGAKQDEPGKH